MIFWKAKTTKTKNQLNFQIQWLKLRKKNLLKLKKCKITNFQKLLNQKQKEKRKPLKYLLKARIKKKKK